MKGRNLATGLLIALVLALGAIFYLGLTGGSRHEPRTPLTGRAEHPTDHRAGPEDAGGDAAARRRQREARDELRRRILEAWARGEATPEDAEDAKRGRFVPHPRPDGGNLEPAEIQAAVRAQMMPMLSQCYANLLSRRPDAGGGTVKMWFKIVADEKLGGIVEEDESDAGAEGFSIDGSFGDEQMRTCVRESLYTVTFPPPGGEGVVTVGYPIVLSADEPDAG